MKRLAILLVPSLALAEPALRVERMPVTLKLPKRAVAQTPDADTVAEPEAATQATFVPIPKTARDWQERVTLKVRAGVELDGASASGDPIRGGASLASGYADQRPWIVGDAIVGVRDILVPSLGAYFLSSFALDASDAGSNTAFVRPYDSDDAFAIQIKAGYAEWGRDDRRPQKLWLRGGRQFRLDGGSMFAYFDGATVGYRAKGVELSGFAGQRVALYVDTPKGLLFGATAAVDLQQQAHVPARVALDYMGLAVDGLGLGDGTDSFTRHLVSLTGSYDLNKQMKVDVRARLVDAQRDDDGDGAADGLALGRVGARLRIEKQTVIVLVAKSITP